MKILLSGGGTLGSVTPLLAIYETLRDEYPAAEFIWIGTAHGPEKDIVQKAGIRFVALSSGKLRRYLSPLNFFDIFHILIGFGQACGLMWREDPSLCISAGGFVSVPLHAAAWWFGAPTWIHAQDVQIGLAARLMAPFASAITTSIKDNAGRFTAKKTSWLGNPVRSSILADDRAKAREFFKIKSDLPVLLATGGGTGSLRVNQIVTEAIHHLEGVVEILHLFGPGRPQEMIVRAGRRFSHYHPYAFLDKEMPMAYAVADIIAARAGFGTIAEAAALGKPIILIPKPGHQEKNAAYFTERGAALSLDERTTTGPELAAVVKRLLIAPEETQKLGSTLSFLLPIAKKEDTIAVAKFLIKPAE